MNTIEGKVLIAGAGVGGLTLARALHLQGVACEVFEREPELRAVGAGILVQTRAMLALRTISRWSKHDRRPRPCAT